MQNKNNEISMSNNNLFLQVPNSDMVLISLMAKKMGWTIETSESMLEKFISTRPSNVPLSDEEIMDEVRSVRYCKDETDN